MDLEQGGQAMSSEKASFKNLEEFRGEVEDTGILLMTNLVFQRAQRKSYRRKGKMGDGVRKCCVPGLIVHEVSRDED